MQFSHEVALLLVGWLFGLLGPAIVDQIRVRRTLKPIARALAVELDELQIRLADNAYYIAEHLGAFTHDLARWLLASYREYQGLYSDQEAVRLLEEMVRFSDLELHRLNENARTFGTGAVLLPRTFRAHMLEHALTMLPHMPIETQQRLLEIQKQLAILAEDILEIRQQYQLTFDANVAQSFGAHLGKNMERLLRHSLVTSQTLSNLAQTVGRELRGGA